MNKKIKLTMFIIIIVVLSFICSIFFKTDMIKYKLKYNNDKFIIEEKHNKDNYYIKINTKENIYSFYIYDTLTDKRKVVNDLYYYKDKEFECILPIIDSELKIDMMCYNYNDNIIYNYSEIRSSNKKLDDYVKSIKIYNNNKFKNNTTQKKVLNSIKFYTKNNIKNELVITTYKGLILNNKEINIFKNDVYNNKVSTFIDKYYLIADYDNNFEFQYFYIINIETGKITKLKSKEVISLDSYIQGIVDNKVYLYDKDNENQYEIDIEKNKIKHISSSKYIKYYKNKKWEKMNKVNANKEIYFDYTSLDNKFPDYDKVVESDNYYYLFKKMDEVYKLYRVDKENINTYKYIDSVPTLDINFKDNYLYYIYIDNLYYYSDSSGLKTILEYDELKFNKTIKYYIY